MLNSLFVRACSHKKNIALQMDMDMTSRPGFLAACRHPIGSFRLFFWHSANVRSEARVAVGRVGQCLLHVCVFVCVAPLTRACVSEVASETSGMEGWGLCWHPTSGAARRDMFGMRRIIKSAEGSSRSRASQTFFCFVCSFLLFVCLFYGAVEHPD